MKFCSRKHVEICHNEADCPLCEAIDNIENLEEELQEAEKYVEQLETKIEELEKGQS